MSKKINSDKKAVVLCSGGMDSVTVLNMVVKEISPENITVLFVNYNQKTVTKERECSSIAASRVGAKWIEFTLSDLQKITKTALIHEEVKSTEVQGRNAILIGLGSALAQTLKAEKLFIGIQAADVLYGDAQPNFYKYMKKAIKTAYGITLEAPLLHKNKKEIIQIAQKLNVDLNLTYSCYFNDIEPCGTCPSCKARMGLQVKKGE